MDSPTVLIAEDDAAARSGLAQLITNAGYTVTTAADGREALEQVDRTQPGVVLLDIWIVNERRDEVVFVKYLD